MPAGQQLEYRADGAGGAWSTADDMRRFLAALRVNRILDEKFTRLMLKQKTEAWKRHGYGYGIWIDEYPGGGLWLGGTGGEMGSNSEAWFNPASGYQLIVLSNFDPGAAKNVSEFIRARLPVPVR